MAAHAWPLLLTFVSSLLQLLVVRGLLHDVEDGVGELRISKWVCLGIHSLAHSSESSQALPNKENAFVTH